MAKKDLIFLAIAIMVVVVIALFAKPVLSGQGLSSLSVPFIPGTSSTTTISSHPTTAPTPVVMVPYSVLSGNRSGTTEIIEIPFPYWEISYSAEPMTNMTLNGTYLFPRMKIQVVDADDPSRIVRDLEPNLLDARINTTYDPRPWREKVAEGYHRYYFVIHVQEVPSYSLEIRVPLMG